jgi:hypothetical protein
MAPPAMAPPSPDRDDRKAESNSLDLASESPSPQVAAAPVEPQASAELAYEPPAPCPVVPPAKLADETDSYSDWGRATFLSNDDTMSLSSAQRTIFAIEHYLPLRPQFIRRHEFLNYFSFHSSQLAAGDDFSVQPSLAEKDGQKGIYYLALAVRGRTVDLDSRRNLSLTVLVDRSGSMREDYGGPRCLDKKSTRQRYFCSPQFTYDSCVNFFSCDAT